jgi:hypothetical protein
MSQDDDEVEYVSDDEVEYVPRPRGRPNTMPEMGLQKLENQNSFYQFDGTQLLGPVVFTLKGFDPLQAIYGFTDTNGENYILKGKTILINEPIFQSDIYTQYNLRSDVIIWQRDNETEYYLSPEILYDFIDETNRNYNFFIDQNEYLFKGSGGEGGSAVSNTLVKLTVEGKNYRDNEAQDVYYTFTNNDSSKIYNFERNANHQFELIITDTENGVRNYDIYCDTSECNRINSCNDDIDETLDEGEDSADIGQCISCGEDYHTDDNITTEDEYKGLCAPCKISLQISDSDGVVYKPMKQLPFYTFDKLSRRTIGINSRPDIDGPKLIVTMFSVIWGHGMVVNEKFRGQITTLIAEGSQLYGTPGWTATELVETSTFIPGTQCQGDYTCKTHIICVGNPLLPTVTTTSNNGQQTNDFFDHLSSMNATVDDIVQELIQFQNSSHTMTLEQIKTMIGRTTSDTKTKDRIIENYYRSQQAGEFWGICSNVGSNPQIKTGEKYISGYNDHREMHSRIYYQQDLDEAVRVGQPIVRVKFCNIYYENADGGLELNVNIDINKVMRLSNNSKLSDVNRQCEKYLCESIYPHLCQTDTNVMAALTQNPHIELVSINLDNTCNYAGSGIVLSHSGQVPYGFATSQSSHLVQQQFGQPSASASSSSSSSSSSSASGYGQQPFRLFGRRGGNKKTKGKVYKNTMNIRKLSKKQRKPRRTRRTRRNKRIHRKTRK